MESVEEENISEHHITFHGHEEVDEDTFSYLMENWVQTNFRSNVIPVELFDESIEEEDLCIESNFQSSSIERLIQNACVGKYSDSCVQSIQNIINTELYEILRIASKVKDKKILSRMDIVRALEILGICIPQKIES